MPACAGTTRGIPSPSFLRRQESRTKMYYVYILASKRNGTLYIGVSNDLVRRVYEHKNDLIDGFTKQYSVHDLVYFEQHQVVEEAILREKQIKRWKRDWKLRLIEKLNPFWKDLYDDILGLDPGSNPG